MSKLETVQRQIQALLERANHSETPQAEKDLALEKASRLALKYRIDVSVLSAKGQISREPEWREFEIDWKSDFPYELQDMQYMILQHHGVRVSRDGYKITAFGYHEDFVLAGMMWTSVQLHFLTTIAPKWNDAKCFDENVYVIKCSGRSWAQIVEMAPRSYGLTMKSGGKLRSAYARHAKKIGVDIERQPNRPIKWRRSFAESYCSTITTRLYNMKREQDKESQEENPEGTLALRTDEEKIAEGFYERFPHFRPMTEEQKAKERQRRREELEAEQAAYNAMSDEQKAKHNRKKEADRKRADRYWARRAPDEQGWAAGNAAGKKADLGTDARVDNSNKKELA